MKKLLNLVLQILGSLFESKQPYMRNTRNQKLINYWWSKIFYNPERLKR